MRHERSRKDHPQLPLEDDEYVELVIDRTKVGLFLIWGATLLAIALVGISILVLALNPNTFTMNDTARSYLFMLLIVVLVVLTVGGFILSYVYRHNRMYITNQRIIHYSTHALFARSKNVIGLVSVEDVSFRQDSIIQHLFRYGTVRLSTVGDETTYTFPFVDTPVDEINTIASLVHAAKDEGRFKTNKTSRTT